MTGADIAIAVGAAAIVWLLVVAKGIRRVGPNEQGVVVIFGAYRTTLGPGLHFQNPFTRLIRVDLRPRTETIDPFSSAASDGSPIQVSARVEYRVMDAAKSVFQSRDLAASVREAAKSSIGAAIARVGPDGLPSKGWSLSEDARDRLQSAAAAFGVEVARLTLTLAGPAGPTEFPAGRGFP